MSRGDQPRDPEVGRDDKGRPIYGYNADGIPVCYSKKPGQNGARCMNLGRMENGRCRAHGGKVHKGALHHNFRSGKYMDVSPAQIAVDLALIAEDKDYLSLRPEMDLNTARLLDTMRQFEEGFDTTTFQVLEQQCNLLEILLQKDDVANFMREMGGDEKSNLNKTVKTAEALIATIRRGADQKKLHREITEISEARRKLADTEIKRVSLERNHLPLDQALTIYGLIMLSIRQNVKDVVALRAIAKDIDGIVILKQMQARTMAVDHSTLEKKVIEANVKHHTEIKGVGAIDVLTTEDERRELREKDPIIIAARERLALGRANQIKYIEPDYDPELDPDEDFEIEESVVEELQQKSSFKSKIKLTF